MRPNCASGQPGLQALDRIPIPDRAQERAVQPLMQIRQIDLIQSAGMRHPDLDLKAQIIFTYALDS